MLKGTSLKLQYYACTYVHVLTPIFYSKITLIEDMFFIRARNVDLCRNIPVQKMGIIC